MIRSRTLGRLGRKLRSHRKKSFRKLIVETLEDRRVLATIGWDGGGDGQSWLDAANWEGNRLPGADDDVVLNVADQEAEIFVYGSPPAVRSVSNHETLIVLGTPQLGTGRLTTGSLVNQGTLGLESTNNGASAVIDVQGGSVVNAAGATLDVLSHAGGSRQIIGALINDGEMRIEGSRALLLRGDQASFEQRGGRVINTVEGARGTVDLAGGELIWSGGTMSEHVHLLNSVINITSGVDQTVDLRARGTNTLVNNLAPNVTIFVEATGSYGSAKLIAAAGAENHGSIHMASSHSWYSTTLDASNTLVNSGSVSFARSQTSTGYFVGTFDNSGLISIGANASGNFQGTYIGNGGSIEGNLFFHKSTIRLEQPAANPTRVRLYENNTLASNIPNNHVLEVAGTGSYGSAKLTFSQDVVNHGKIEMNTHHSWYSSHIDAGAFSFTNAADGEISVHRGQGNARTITAGLTNLGIFSVEANQTVWISGAHAALNMTGGRLSGAGTIAVDKGSIQWTGGDIDVDVAAKESVLDVGNVNDAATIRAWVSNSLIRNYGEDVTIHVEGTGAYGSSTLIAQTNAENRGTLRLASSHSWYSVTLDANNELLNTGTILVQRNQTSTGFLRGAFRNAGLIAIGSGAAGDFIGTYIGDGGSVTGNLFLRDSVVQLEKAHRDPTRLRLYKSNQLVTDNMPNTTLEVAGTGAYGSTTLTLGQSLSNHGTIELVTHHSWYSSTIEAGEFELTNTPDGSIVVKRGQGNARYLRGELINDGQVQIEPNQTWWINGPQSAIQMRDGRISGGGTLAIDAGQVQWTGGALDTTVATLNSTLDISSVTDAATIRAWKNNTLLKNIGESVIVHVEGTGTYGSATLTAAPNAENRGTIKLASSHSWYSVTIDATEPLLNSGTIDIVRNQTSTGILRGTIRNSGHIQVGSNAGGDFIGTYVGLGGSTSGNLYFRDSTLELESAPETTSHLRLYKSNTLASDIPANMLLEVAGTGSYGNTTLHVSQPVTNHGTVRLVSHHSWYSSSINPGDNLFTNAADGIIEVHAGSGNSRHWTGSLTNAGRIRLHWPLNLGSTGSSVINSGIIDSQSTLLLKSQDFQNLEGAFLGGGSLNLGSTTLVDQGTIDQGSPALVDATFDPAIVELKFNADMDAGDLNTAGNYQLWLAGPDAQWGTADDQNISDRIQSVTSDLEGRTAWLIISPILESSEARVVLDGSVLHSSGGTPLFGDSIIVNRPTEQLPPSLTFELPDDQDTGISANDGVTRLNSPEFVYRVNKPGVMSIDFENDGEVDAQFTVDLPGEFRWQAPQLPDANFPVLATFSDGNNEVIDSYALTIDTTAPELLPGDATQTAPFYGREFQFTEPVNSSLLNKDDLTLTGPAGPIAITGVTGSNATYTFATNIQIAAGTHRLAIPPAVSDLAGNTLALNNGEVVDQFELLPDLDPPELDDLSPVGLRGTGVESIMVQFNEEMDASSFASADIQVLLPDGSQADPSQFTVQPTSTTRFTVQATGLDSAGHYQLTIGPGIKDLSGNEMEQPGRGEFTIDSIGPRIVNDSIPATIHDSFTRFELSTSEPVQVSSLRDALSIVDPNGQNLSSVSVWQHAHNQYAVAFPSLRDQGNYEVRIANTVVDLLGNQLDQNNNQVNGEDQDVFSATFEVRLPELAFDGLPTLSSTSVALGDSLQVQWNVENIGLHSTQGTWHDRVFLSKDGNVSSDDWALGSVPVHAADVNATNGYQKTFDITIPMDRNLVPGDYQILVQTNAGDDLYESNPGNNSAFTTATLRLPPLPDLALDSVQLVGGNFLPGDKVNLSWTLSNIGSASAEPVWIERVFLSPSIAGNDAWLIHEHAAVEAIAAGAHATRNLDVTIPKIGPVGQWFAFVMIDAADEVFETNEVNPPRFTQASFTIEKKLTLESFRTRVSEDGEPIALLISRNGPTDEALEVALATAPGSQLEVPASVVIPANSASTTVYATPVDGDGVDGPATVNIQVSADGFVAAEVAVTVDDIDQAALVFEALPEMREGEIHSVTLRRTDDLQSSKEVTLRVQSPAQFELPESVSFSAGQSEVTFDLLVVDDPILEKETVTRIEATASDYVSAFANLTVVSSDIPNLTLLMPVGLSEEEGLKYLSVERGEPSPHPLQLQFRTDSPDQISFPRFATIPGGETSITFPIQVIDDDLTEPLTEVAIFVDGLDPRTGDVLSPPLASATTTIADNDQPALSLILDRTLVAEGGTIQGLVRRNEATEESLTVQLESRDTGELTVPPMVTIAAGMRTAAFPIDGQKDGTVDGEQRVTILVSADGWATGQGAVVVSDSDLPDLVAVISEMDADVHTQQSVTLEWELRNQGVAPADAGRQRLFLRNEQTGDEILLDESQLTEDLLPGHGIRYRVPVELPQQVGQYRFVVRVDVLSQVREIIEYNNLSEADQVLNVQEAYTVSVESDVDVAQAGTPITLTGRATDAISGEPVAMQSVHVHIRHGSTHRLLTALTDDQGQYAVTFRPLSGEAGAYHVGASHPGNSQYDIQDTFTLVGFRLNASRITVQEAATAVGTLRIQNQSEVDLNDLTVEILDFPDNLSVEATLDATSVAGNSSTGVQIRVTANDATYVRGYIHVRVGSANAPDRSFQVPVTIVPLRSRLSLDLSRLTSTMCVGHQSLWKVTVTNTGSKLAEDLRIILPSGAPWMTLASPLPHSLEVGESASFELLLSPPEDLDLTVYSGSIGIQAFDNWTSLPFDLRAVSQATADLRIRVADEYYYFSDDKPLLEGARVSLLDAFTSRPIENIDGMQTAQDGTVTFEDILEGYYLLEVSGDNHETYRETIRVQPGITNDKLIFISRQAVTYNWTVEEIEIEDRYLIDIEALFETNVPMPVVHTDARFDLAELQEVGQEMQVLVKVTNDGLVAVNDVALNFGNHPYYSFEPLVDSIDVLPAKTELSIPVVVRRVGGPGGGAGEGEGSVPCQISISLTYVYICDELIEKGIPIPVFNVEGDCRVAPSPPRSYHPSGGGGGGGGSPPRSSVTPVKFTPPDLCDCIPVKFKIEASSAGPLGSLTNRVAQYVTSVVPLIKEAEIGGKGSVEFEKCCDDDAKRGWGIKAEAALDLKMTWVYGLGAGFSFEVFENLPLGLAGAQLDVELDGTIGFETEVSTGINGYYNAPCDSENSQWCVGANLQANLFFGVDVEVEVDIELPGQSEKDIRGKLKGGLQTGAEAFVRYCDTGLEYDACWKGLSLVGQVTFPFKGANVSAGVEVVLIAPDPDCGKPGAGGGGNGEHAEDDIEIMTIADIVAGLNYDSVEEMNQALGTNFGSDDVLHESQVDDTMERQYFYDLPSGQGVCAQVTLAISQELVLTRQGFDARLEMDNGSNVPLRNFQVDVTVYDADGKDVTELFVFRDPVFSGFTQVDGTGELAAGTAGNSSWVLIPLSEAAPDAITEYFVGGQINYTDTGRKITIDLEPVSINVRPQPELDLIYFHQRDVISDDPFTEEIEDAEPFALGVLIKNSGGGAAHNLRIESAQPRIVENEKGLLIDFEIIGTDVNGGPVEPTLTAEFGDLPPRSNAVAMWRMVASLQGLFVDYKATFRHLDPSGDPRLSLIKSVEIHEMIRPVRAANSEMVDDGLPDFLVNDSPDPLDLPDTLYLSDGSVEPVERASEPEFVGTPTVANLFQSTVYANMPAGWGYVRLDDPADGQYKLVSVRRPDGTELPSENFWTTNRTFVGGGRRPLVENKLHILDRDGAGTYTLVYSNGDLQGPQLLEFTEITPNPTTIAIDEIGLQFDEPIDQSSVTSDDFRLLRNGTPQEFPAGLVIQGGGNNSSIRVSGLSAATGDDAVYELIVDLAGVTDPYGNQGEGAESVTWVKGEAAPAIVSLLVSPGQPASDFDSVDLTMTEPIRTGLVLDALSAELDGQPLGLPQLSLIQVSDRSYRIAGLNSVHQSDGVYSLKFDAMQIADLDGLNGIGTRTIDWVIDTVGPAVTEVKPPATDPRNIAVQRIDFEFSEPIDVDTLTVNDLALFYESEGINLLADDSRVEIVQQDERRFRAYGITWPQARPGEYEFRVDASGVIDHQGNAGSGVQSITWTLDLERPLVPLDLQWQSPAGSPVVDSTTDRIVHLAGTLPESNLRLGIHNLATGERLRTITDAAIQLDLPIELPHPGTNRLELRLIDSAGNVTRVDLPELEWNDKPAVLLSQNSEMGLLPGNIAGPILEFNEAIDPGTFSTDMLSLRRNGKRVDVSGVTLVRENAESEDGASGGYRYRLSGLDAYLADSAAYQLETDFADLRTPDGRRTSGESEFRWQVDSEAPEISSYLHLAHNGPSQAGHWQFNISESVNLDQHIADHIIHTLFPLNALGIDAQQGLEQPQILGTEAYQYVRNEDGSTQLLVDTSALSDGVYQWTPVEELIVDPAGNPLADMDPVVFHQLLADVDGDGAVDRSDVAIVIGLQGVSSESQEWNPAADLNANGSIDAADLSIVRSRLGRRVVYPSDDFSNHQNPNYIYDANADNFVSPLDALLVINHLNKPADSIVSNGNFLDINGDTQISPIDALLVINLLNRQSQAGAGEGERSFASHMLGTSSLTELQRAQNDLTESLNGIVDEALETLDFSGDGQLTALDALLVTNRINWLSFGDGDEEDDLIKLLAEQ